MSEETLDIRARLSADDQLSPTMKRIIGQFDAMDKKFKNSFSKNKIPQAVDKDTLKRLSEGGKLVNGLTDGYVRQARALRASGAMTANHWRDINQQLEKNMRVFNKAEGAKKAKARESAIEYAKQAQAFAYVWNQSYEKRTQYHEKMHDLIGRAEGAAIRKTEARKVAAERAEMRRRDKFDREYRRAKAEDVSRDVKNDNMRRMAEVEAERRAQAHIRMQRQAKAEEARIQTKYDGMRRNADNENARRAARAERERQRSQERSRNNFYSGFNMARSGGQQMMQGVRTASIYPAAAGAAAIGLGRTSVREAIGLDRAETNARINMDQSKVGARDMRDNWALPGAIRLGQSPSSLMSTGVEAAKAGVPELLAKGTAELVTMMSKTMGVPVEQAMDGLGYAIAQEIGAGRLKSDNIDGVTKLANITAFLANKTAARPDQMFSFLRTGMGSGAMLGMSQEATLAFGATGIQAGAQGQQTARFLGSLGETLAGLTMEAKTIRGHGTQSPKDRKFLKLPSQLGYGGYGDIENSIRQRPDTAIFDLIKSFGKIKDPLEREQAMTSMFGADFARFLSNMISSPEMLDNTLKLAKQAAEQKTGANFITESWSEYTRSLEHFINVVSATWSVLKVEIGDVLKPFIGELSAWVSDWYSAVKTGGIKSRLKAILDGLVEGLIGKPGTFRDLLDNAFGKPGEVGSVAPARFFAIARGFATGLREAASAIWGAFQSIAKYFNGGDGSEEAIGRFAGKVVALVAALTLLSPVIGVFSALVGGILMLVGAFKMFESLAIGKLLGGLGGKMLGGAAGGPIGLIFGALVDDLLKGGNAIGAEKIKPEERQKLIDAYKAETEQKKRGKTGDGSSGSGGSGSWDETANPLVKKMSYSMNDMTEKFDRFGGMLQRASFISGSGTFSGNGGGGGGGGLGGSGGGFGSAGSFIGSTPGSFLPNMGGSSGPMIRRGGTSAGVPSFTGGGGTANDGVGAGLSGSSFLSARRQKFAAELQNDPNLRMHIAAMQATEGVSQGGTIESLMNRADMQGKTMRQMLGYSADGQINPKSFYGPIRRGELAPAIERLKRNPSEFAKYDAFTNRALGGSHVIGGHTDQGLPTDPNGSARTGIPGLRLRGKNGKLDGNEFTDWVGPGSSWGRGRGGAMNYRKFIEQGISGEGASAAVPGSPPSVGQNVPKSVIDNVPVPISAQGGGGGGFGGGGAGGPVAIHINGHTGDPEVLATQVQRRIEETMNWRTHDMDPQSI